MMNEFGNKLDGKVENEHTTITPSIRSEVSDILNTLFSDDYEGVEGEDIKESERRPFDSESEMEALFADDYEPIALDEAEISERAEKNDIDVQTRPYSEFEKNAHEVDREDGGKVYELDGNARPGPVYETGLTGKDLSRTPENHGKWEGERGNSLWIPDADYVPPEKSANPNKPYSNPDNLSWGQILEKYGIKGIPFKNGFPDFSEVSKGTVQIEGFETGGNTEKNRNFKKADVALAEQKGCSPEDVKKWREENNYTWHECEDKETMQKVPNEVHANVPHDGGRSQKD